MTVIECYEKLGGDYKDAMSRFMKEERIVKYLGKFADNKDYEAVEPAFASGDYEQAFRLTHTIKGMAGNMGFTRLFSSASELCETVRHGAPTVDTKPLIEKFLADNKLCLDTIAEFLAQ